MSDKELKLQQEEEFGVTVHQKREKIPASLIDINQSDIVLISEKRILPGTEVDITMNCLDDLAIHGTIKLVLVVSNEGKLQYKLGVEADQILGPEDLLESIPSKTLQ